MSPSYWFGDNVSIKIKIISTVRLLESRRILWGFFFWVKLQAEQNECVYILTKCGRVLGLRVRASNFSIWAFAPRLCFSNPVILCKSKCETVALYQASYNILMRRPPRGSKTEVSCLRKHGREEMWCVNLLLYFAWWHSPWWGGSCCSTSPLPCQSSQYPIPAIPTKELKTPLQIWFFMHFQHRKEVLHLSGRVNSVEGCKHTWWRFALRLYQCTMIVFPPKSEVKPTCKGYTRQPEKGKHNCNLEHICNMKSRYSFIEIILSGMHWCKWITANI